MVFWKDYKHLEWLGMNLQLHLMNFVEFAICKIVD